MQNPAEMFTSIHPLFQVRLFVYDLLRRTFMQEPTREFLDYMKYSMSAEEFPFISDSEAIFEGAQQVKNYIAQNDIADETTYNSLHWDYTRLFIGPHAVPAPPWESAYCNEERLLFQKETIEVRKAYLKYSFLPVEFGAEADDHLGLELDFMFRLNELALTEIDKQDSKLLREILADQKLFLEGHLLKWVPSLCTDIIKHAQTEYYRGMANLLKGFLILDLKALNELLEIVL
ncbi:MAG: molecular chaperone TorD family protein [Negativicutes bacterium]|nr:molecular chaperone TorD family protein [Negativicutes bacterium]